MFTGIESMQARFEEDATSTETAVDVEVRVAEEVEEATAIAEEATDIATVSEEATQVVEEAEALESWAASIQKYGLTAQGLDIMNYKGKLAAISGVMMPGSESLDLTGRNHEAAQVVMEGIKDTMKKAWEAIKKFFITIWEKIKGFFAKIMTWITAWERSCKKAYESIKDIEVDDKKLADKKVKLMSASTLDELAVFVGKFVNIGEDVDATLNSISTKHQEILGIKKKSDGEIEVTSPKTFDEASLTTLKYNAKYLSDKYAVIRDYLGNMRVMQKISKNIESLTKTGVAKAESLIKSGDLNKSDDKSTAALKEDVKTIQKDTKKLVKMVSSIGSRMSIVPSTYVKACAAVRSCKK